MVLGEHGRHILKPLTPLQAALAVPWKRLYKHSIYFRMFSAVGTVTLLGWAYIGFKGTDVWFTPYSAVHHSIAHSYAHDLDHKRYPVEHHHDDKHKH